MKNSRPFWDESSWLRGTTRIKRKRHLLVISLGRVTCVSRRCLLVRVHHRSSGVNFRQIRSKWLAASDPFSLGAWFDVLSPSVLLSIQLSAIHAVCQRTGPELQTKVRTGYCTI